MPESAVPTPGKAHAEAPAEPPGNTASFRLAVLLGSLTAIGPLAIDMYLPAFPQIANDLSVDIGAVQFTLSVYFAGAALGQALYGPIADRFGRRLPLLAGMTIFLVASGVCAFARSIETLTLARLGMALGGASGMVVARAVVRDRYDTTEMAKMFSLLMLVMGVAPILAPSLGGLLLEITGWRGIFVFLMLYAAVCILTSSLWLKETLPSGLRMRGGIRQALRTYGQLALHPWFVAHTLIAAAVSVVLFGYVSAAPTIFAEYHGLSARSFAILFGCNSIALIAASQLNRWLLSQFAPRAILLAGTGLLTFSSLILLLSALSGINSILLTEIGVVLMLASVGIVFPNVGALAMTPFASMAGSAGALQGTSQFAMGALSGAVIALLHDGTPLPAAAVFVVGSGVACAVAVATRHWSGG